MPSQPARAYVGGTIIGGSHAVADKWMPL